LVRSKIIIFIEKEKDMRDKLYAKLSEEHKLLMEEHDVLKLDLNDQRKKVWDLEYKLKQHVDDQTSIQKLLDTVDGRKMNVDGSSDRYAQR
jgi:16S rRNA A1518/A1519 N6-dimethyltransferase RsmA/KsgA/DIM1 with predicted DNA glycosylase/AP lyase activity